MANLIKEIPLDQGGPATIVFFAIIALTTMATRFLPFLLFPENKKTPKYIEYLGAVLPNAIIGMLVVYSLKNLSFLTYPYGLPELITVGAIIIFNHFKENMLLAIGGGTLLYMVLVQKIFVLM